MRHHRSRFEETHNKRLLSTQRVEQHRGVNERCETCVAVTIINIRKPLYAQPAVLINAEINDATEQRGYYAITFVATDASQPAIIVMHKEGERARRATMKRVLTQDSGREPWVEQILSPRDVGEDLYMLRDRSVWHSRSEDSL